MLKFPDISPSIFKIGVLEVRWYGFMYVLAFLLARYFGRKMLKKNLVEISDTKYEDYIFSLMLGVLIGGRVGYILFYHFSYYLNNPIEIIKFWHGGMSFHGGALGVIVSGLLFCRKNKFNFYRLADPMMPLVAIGLGLGRIGNFINGELYGRITNLPWGIIFPNSDGLSRHPSQLYEAFFEGFVLAGILFFLLSKKFRDGIIFWSFIGGYGIIRFLLEFLREPDLELGFVFLQFTQGQVLSSIMILVSIIAFLMIFFRKKCKR